MLEAVLMRGLLMLYASDYEIDDNSWPYRYYRSGKSSSSEWRSFTLLSSVCCDWHQTLVGWPQSSTPRWVKHKVRKIIERKSFYRCIIM